MSSLLEADRPRVGLRERKKLKTRAALQDVALRLFREQGYAETTVEQIAEAAEVSASTFCRYFPTKEDVVLYDALDPLLIEAFRAQPAELSPLQALRATMREVFGAAAPEIEAQAERAALLLAVPELRMRMLNEFVQTIDAFSVVVAERVGRAPDDFAVRTLVGAVIGVGIAVWLAEGGSLGAGYIAAYDRAFGLLEAGLPL
ncbi:MAG TPA: TetR family transcriptional regulator [Verrucomicrobiae bacterium]|nr:TetR family transcriptional regulator [Verrucomicrobiae bacterium]